MAAAVYSFRVYIAGRTPRSLTALANLRLLCETYLPDRHEIDLVDVSDRPELAERDGVLATPMAVRIMPLPEVRVIGDLADHRKAAGFLGLVEAGRSSPEERRR
ncbi:circadian clock KaiB family protein [Actinomadura sp. B10D3]|uniref:circadian clock KaiB family protein n=1 Tax=Actinomadura sp. B10D3 TaxID=3153557 RepID=UPI00325D6B74